ncbi:amidohydrolase [Leifsonia shinshuensis]|uniref:amidohydrolase n=1 Tax=Leifsonia shinshuensis TaxID=150026 RepID=UPI001F506C01|nr:amidohydrolase [Leifsonia shinshuensis]MCI0156494.1 amidohydrolase [Leifsonia shinshuensis]
MDLILAGSVPLAPGGRPVHAIGIADGHIVAVGDRADIRDWRGRGTAVYDVGSAAILPGFTDGHTHPVLGANLTAGVSLRDARDLDSVRRLLADEAATAPPGEWLRGWGLLPDVFGGRAPSRSMIDDATGGRPALLRMFDGHSALASSAALLAAGIHGAHDLPGVARIVCDEDGSPTGYLREPDAVELVERAAPALSSHRQAALLRTALEAMSQAGLTGIHALEFDDAAARLYRALEDDGPLPVTIRCMPWCPADSDRQAWSALAGMQNRRGDRWRVGGAKFFLDGTIDDGTAWLSEHDSLGGSTAPLWHDLDAYGAAIRYFAERGIVTATHAIGDQAVLHAADAIDRANAGLGSHRRVVPHRIEHIEYLSGRGIARIAASSATISMQPTHCTDFLHPDETDNWSIRMGHDRLANAWPLGRLEAAGVPLVLGSDWPIAGFDPRRIIASACLRRSPGSSRAEAIAPHQALSIPAAIAGYTVSAARSVGDGAIAGSIEVGKRADLSVFAADPSTAPLDEFVDAPVVGTVVAGSVVFMSA